MTIPDPLRGFVFTGCALAATCVIHVSAWGNVGPPSEGGQIVAEPVGLKKVDITHETLTLDMRPLVSGELVHVEAIYHMHNHSSEQQLALLFAVGSEAATDFEVWLGDQSMPSSPAEQEDLPASWQPPKQTPGMHGENNLSYLQHGVRQVIPRAFAVTLPSGRQTLKVRYRAEAARNHEGRRTDYWQFAYVLAPAREWARFGGLDVTVHLPDGWRAACTPELFRDGGTLRGHFSDLPADAVALTAQAPVGWAYQPLVYLGWGLFALAGFGGAILCWWGGRSEGRFRERVWPRALGLGTVWGGVVLVTGFLALFAPDVAIPAFQKNTNSYGQAFAMLGVIALGLLVLPVGFVIAMATGFIVRRRGASQNASGVTESAEASRG